MTWLRIVSVVLVIGASTASYADEKKKREEVSAADADKLLVFFGKFVDSIVQNKDNCPTMAKAVTTVIDANQDAVKLANQAKADNKQLPKPIEEKMMARVKELMPAMQKCGGDKDVKAAIAKLDKKPDAKTEK